MYDPGLLVTNVAPQPLPGYKYTPSSSYVMKCNLGTFAEGLSFVRAIRLTYPLRPGIYCSALSCGWLARINNSSSFVTMDVE
ncbi:hypothetical protein EVAR_96845_1 [Eumeta japonica]|uniref:Uncharacterized protein n=1 Tax=Eumeta variegata TaxID=151549 RepID=A0A4C1WA31_EUMVA|nr:hypothetical protein EVAR_96845_1 [Eumeta japonica]